MISSNMADWLVLIVDDEPDNVGVAQKVLKFNGAQVAISRNGLEGLEALQTLNPSFILLDLSMPEMDGWEMLRQIRAQAAFDNTPVIALTAHAMAGDKERVIDAGFDGYISKPFRINSFLDDIQACLSNFKQNRA